MALWQPLLVLALIAGTVGATYAVFRLRYPAAAARNSDAGTRAAAGPPVAPPPDPGRPAPHDLRPGSHDGEKDADGTDDTDRLGFAPDPDPQWTVSEVVGDATSAARRLRAEPAEIVSVVLAEMSDGSVRVSRGAVPAPAEAADRIVERIHTVTARNLMDAAWMPATSGWEISDPGWFDGAAGALADADRALHAVLVGRTSAATAERFGLTADVAGGAGDFAAVLVPLPFDNRVASVVRAVRVVGLVFGVATGHVPLALACAKSLARTEITTRLRHALTTMTDPSRDRLVTDRPATPEPTRDTAIRETDARAAAREAAAREAGSREDPEREAAREAAPREAAAPEAASHEAAVREAAAREAAVREAAVREAAAREATQAAAGEAAARDAAAGDAEWTARRSRSDEDDPWRTSRGASRADQDEWSSRSDPPSRDREGPWGGAPGPW